MEKILAVCLGAAIVLVLGFKWFVRKNSFKNRQPVALEAIYNEVKDEVSFDTFAEVYKALGQAYSVDSRLIRPSDPLKRFFDIDSWELDAGTDKMNQWLISKNIHEKKSELVTVLDLLLLANAAAVARKE